VDPVLEDARRRAEAEEATVGVLLIGSRAAGRALADSDYDFLWIVTDAELEARDARGEARQSKEGHIDVQYLSTGRLAERASELDWATRALLTSEVVVDKTGEVTDALRQMGETAEARARADVASEYDTYLNSYVRSLKAWRRDDELGGRMHAVESTAALARMLHGVAGRWPPYHDELERALPELEAELGLRVVEDMRAIVRSGDPSLQQELETRVETFMTERGVLHEWDDALDKLRTWRF
jgi:predicted nucleotidyltransferase